MGDADQALSVAPNHTSSIGQIAQWLKSRLFRDTGWSFVNSGGGEIDVGFMKVLFGGVTGGVFYAQKDGDDTLWRMPFAAGAFGAGLGASLSGPVTVSVSIPTLPSGGFHIYRNPLRMSAFDLSCFPGAYVALSGAVSGLASANVTLIIFGASEWIVNLAAAITLSARIEASLLDCQGAGIMWGTALSDGAGIGATAYAGHIFAATAAAKGETDP